MGPKQKEVIWSRELAYVVGLITTDGNLSKDGRHMDFTSNDIDLIETFKKCLGINNRVGRKWSTFNQGFTCSRVQFGNVTLYRWLIKIGLMPNKSKSLGVLKIPDKYFFDFLRGHLDGDGSIRKYYDPVYKNSLRLYLSFMSASLKHLKWLRIRIEKLTSRRGFIKASNAAYELMFSKYDSISLLKNIYYKPNLPQLKRKFRIAQEFLPLPR